MPAFGQDSVTRQSLGVRLKSRIKHSWGRIAVDGFFRGLSVFWLLIKIMVPVYLIVTFLKFTPVLPALAHFFSPYMQIFGLPGGAALAIVIGNTVNLYAAIAVIASLKMSSQQVTIIAVMLAISHSLPMEITITQKMKTRFMTILFLRLSVSFLAGIASKHLLL
jgi:spore maturation protein SpmB